jgi:hypothetical protein
MSAKGHQVHVSYHKWMLQDEVRADAMQRMIDELVRPGDIVADVGTGTGILALMAVRAGAKRVHAIDASPIVRLVRQVAADNDLSDRLICHEADASTLMLDEPVDVIFSECLGNFAFGDGMFRALQAFSEHNLAPGGRRGPTEVRMFLQPADSRLFWDPHRFWQAPFDGFDLSAFVPAAENCVNVVDVVSSFCWDKPALVTSFDPFARADFYDLSASWAIPEGRLVTGITGWFEVDWAPNSPMGTGPNDPGTHWSQTIFPVPPRTAEADERLEITVHVAFHAEERVSYRWSGRWTDGEGTTVVAFERGEDLLFAT